ncbi:MAG: hypothetical protein O3A63_20405 [Proteobacteria bacterium]|nr:hypothetical protein [Pseudomonadota bacterium]
MALEDFAHQHPHAHFTGVEINPMLIDFSASRMPPNTAMRFVQYDLRDAAWTADLQSLFDVAYTFQTLHDLGGRDALQTVYSSLASTLPAGGMLVNADFVVPMPQDDPRNPRRFPVHEHVELLHQAGCKYGSGRKTKMDCISYARG